jgi:U2 small nuclear ribonucleoprotein B''
MVRGAVHCLGGDGDRDARSEGVFVFPQQPDPLTPCLPPSRPTTPNTPAQTPPQPTPTTELKQCLHAIFSQFGRILDIVACKTLKLKGQAWVVFEDAGAAGAALRGMQGFPFYGKPMRLTYALTRSDAAAKADGTWKPADKEARAKAKAAALAGLGGAGGGAAPAPAGAAGPTAAAAAPPPAADAAPPHHILFVQGLPPATTEAMLALLFEQFPGFAEARLVPAKPGIAFVEFGTPAQAGAARAGLDGFKVTGEHAMSVSFAKQ